MPVLLVAATGANGCAGKAEKGADMTRSGFPRPMSSYRSCLRWLPNLAAHRVSQGKRLHRRRRLASHARGPKPVGRQSCRRHPCTLWLSVAFESQRKARMRGEVGYQKPSAKPRCLATGRRQKLAPSACGSFSGGETFAGLCVEYRPKKPKAICHQVCNRRFQQSSDLCVGGPLWR